MIKYLRDYYYGSDLLIRKLSFILAFQHLNLGTNLHEYEDQSWFTFQAL
jgi:hypothetical protein